MSSRPATPVLARATVEEPAIVRCVVPVTLPASASRNMLHQSRPMGAPLHDFGRNHAALRPAARGAILQERHAAEVRGHVPTFPGACQCGPLSSYCRSRSWRRSRAVFLLLHARHVLTPTHEGNMIDG